MTPGEPLIRPDWIVDHLGDIAQRLGEHLLLTVLAVAIGLLLAFPISVWIARRPRWQGFVLGLAGVLYTIPSLALFAILVPITGLTVLTAEIGLVGYTLVFLMRNLVEGIGGVPADVRDAALGMGYTSRQLLWRVELPLALPAIMAGVRIATVSTVGLVTVTALIGQGGLGYFILEGLQRFFSTPLIVGAVLSVALAVVADGLLVLVQRWATPWAGRGD